MTDTKLPDSCTMKCHGMHLVATDEQPAHSEHCEILNGPITTQRPKPPGMHPDAPNFEKVTEKDCTHTGYYVPMGYDSFPVANGDAVLVSFGVICMRCGKIWPHVQLLESPLAKVSNLTSKDKFVKS